MDRVLADKVALVTGASRGIGRAIAVALGARGARVAVNYVANEAAAEAARQAVEAAGGSATLARFDVADPAAVSEGVKKVAEAHGGRIDIVVNNAGLAIDGLMLRLSDADWKRSLDVNLGGCMVVTRASLKYVMKAGKDGLGRIVNLTSVVGEMGSAGQAGYVAAKAGIIGLTKTLAREVASRGVTVNAVSPGFIDTDMTAEHIPAEGEARAKLLAQIPLGRIGRPEDVADAVAFLASPAAGYITGQVLRVNGGLLM